MVERAVRRAAPGQGCELGGAADGSGQCCAELSHCRERGRLQVGAGRLQHLPDSGRPGDTGRRRRFASCRAGGAGQVAGKLRLRGHQHAGKHGPGLAEHLWGQGRGRAERHVGTDSQQGRPCCRYAGAGHRGADGTHYGGPVR